jgi:flavin reductase (DIM6/NTAB) family NADH-FMN oxidoreductase RutF
MLNRGVALMRVTTAYLKYLWPMRHYLLTCGEAPRVNIIAVSFCMPVSKEPPMVACAIGRGSYSLELIEQTREFVINVPPEELQREIAYCGFHSGREVDKFRLTGLTPAPAQCVDVPIVEECVAQLECRVEQIHATGDKSLCVARVVAAYADEAVELGQRSVAYAAGDFPAAIYGNLSATSSGDMM